MVAFSDDINKEFAAILKKRDRVVKTGAVSLFGDLQVSTPVDSGDLRRDWQNPEKISIANWRISNISPYAEIIDGGRREAMVNGTIRWVGSEQLPKGFQPIIDEFEPKLQRELDKIK